MALSSSTRATTRCRPLTCQTDRMDFRIRPIAGDEWRLWRSLRLQAVEESPDAFRGTLDRESAEANEWWIRLIATTAEHPHALLLVAEVGSDPVGMLFGRLDDDAEVLDVGSMWVDPTLRRRGIGTGLINAALDWARDAGAGQAELWVTRGNVAAEELYDKIGFVTTGDTEALREGSELRVVKLSAEI